MSTPNQEDSNYDATGAQATPARAISGAVRDAFQQFQASVSQYLTAHQRIHEDLARFMDLPNLKIVKIEQKIEDHRRMMDTIRDLIRNYRQ